MPALMLGSSLNGNRPKSYDRVAGSSAGKVAISYQFCKVIVLAATEKVPALLTTSLPKSL